MNSIDTKQFVKNMSFKKVNLEDFSETFAKHCPRKNMGYTCQELEKTLILAANWDKRNDPFLLRATIESKDGLNKDHLKWRIAYFTNSIMRYKEDAVTITMVSKALWMHVDDMITRSEQKEQNLSGNNFISKLFKFKTF